MYLEVVKVDTSGLFYWYDISSRPTPTTQLNKNRKKQLSVLINFAFVSTASATNIILTSFMVG